MTKAPLLTDIYLSLGSNMGDRRHLLSQAIELIQQRVGQLIRCSSFIETEPWGFSSSHDFLNAAVSLRTNLLPEVVLKETQRIERMLGRTHKSTNGQYSDRPIDIDILFYGHQVISQPHLTIPHPLLHKRLFVLQPLAEIAPEMVHPLLHRTVSELLSELRDNN